MDKWHNCYDDSWKGIIVPEAFAHPAKMARGLTNRIFKHAMSESWIKPGDVVVDPFGGIGSTGIIGAHCGLQVVCVELEQKFVDLAEQNFKLHHKSIELYSHFGKPLHPVIIQGDSRRLSEVIAGADCVVGSPPFAEAQTGGGINKKGYHNEAMRKGVFDLVGKRSYTPENQGQTEGNLAAMKPGSVDAVVSSPPYADGCRQDGGVDPKPHYIQSGNKDVLRSYGITKGNLGNLKPGEVDSIISSPPFEDSLQSGCPESKWKLTQQCIRDGKGHASKKLAPSVGKDYGNSEGQLGADKGETFWQAARQIVAECHKILKPGGHAIWVVKSFVRKGKIVDFPGDWRRLCESQGFTTVCEHQAMLVKETRHDGLFEEIVETKERKSFFRGLIETKAAWKKYWNTVPSENEKAVWRFRASMMCRWWSEPPVLCNPLAMCFEASGEDERDWNEHVRIDFEQVLCMMKVRCG